MKITKFTANNFMNLKCIEIHPNGQPIVLSGKNGAGKSSILNAICAVMQGGKARVDQPIRYGQEKAEIVAETEAWTARKLFTHKNPSGTLEITSNDGRSKFTSPQALLDQVWGDLSFDPLAFKNMDAKKQHRVIMELAKLDWQDIDIKRQKLYSERTLQNNEAARLEGALQSMALLHLDAPENEIAVQDIMSVLDSLERGKNQYEQHQMTIRNAERHLDEATNSVNNTQEEIARLQANLHLLEESVIKRNDILQRFINDTPDVVTDEQIQGVKNQMVARDGTNAKVRHNACRTEIQNLFEAAQAQNVRLTNEIISLDQAKQDALANSTFPLPGLSLSDGDVLYEGVPLSQISDGEAIRVSTAIAMALNPSLQVVFVRNGSLLDREGMQVIYDLAESKGYQVWIESVADEPSSTGIFLEEGEITFRDGLAVENPQPV